MTDINTIKNSRNNHGHSVDKIRNRQHYEKNSLIEELWTDEVQALWALPETDYPVGRALMVTTNKYNEILLDNSKTHIPRARNHSLLTAYLAWGKYKVFSGNGEVINEGDRSYMGNSHKIPWGVIMKDWRRKLSTIHYSRYWKYLPGRIQHYLSTDDLRVSDFVIDLEKHWRNHTHELFKKRFDKVKCIILDEMGYLPFMKDGSELLFQLISCSSRSPDSSCTYFKFYW